MKKVKTLLLISLLTFSFSSCTNEEVSPDLNNVLDVFLGWFGESENLGNIENDLNLSNNSNLPPSVDLSGDMPPVKSQGNYGTCVTWATAYYTKTYLEGKDKNLSYTDLSSTSNQFSPKDLFYAIPSSSKGANCNGSHFEAAFDVMLNRGVAPLSTVPYTNLGDCSAAPDASWTSVANQYKITSYREITPVSVSKIKSYINQGRPVVIGARLGEYFMSWNSADILSSDTQDYKGQHAYHALTVVGYDDSKGSVGAFKIINSWGTDWGSNGYIWVDYNFFVQQFCYAAFVAYNKTTDPDVDNNGTVDNTVSNSTDLAAWSLNDIAGTGSTRDISYDVYNKGTNTIYATSDWSIAYVWYDAYNANNYGILLYDYYSDDYGVFGTNAQLTSGGLGSSDNWYNHVNVNGGQSVAEAVNGTSGAFSWSYTLPSTLNGKYYLCLIADPFDDIQEHDETNNYYFFTNPNGSALTITNGVLNQDFNGSGAPTSRIAVDNNNKNAYTPNEIKALLKNQMQTGELQKRIRLYVQNKKGKS